MNSEKHIFFKKITAALLAMAIITVMFSSCGTSKGAASVRIKSITENKTVFSSRDYHISSGEKNLVFVKKSGLIELYFDSITYGIAVKETGTGKVWYSLPQASNGDEKCEASVIGLKVSKDDQIYYLNSQDNSVAFSSASFKPTSNGIQITYDMALDSETAQKGFDSITQDDLYVSVTAVYSLSDGTFYAKINSGDMLVSSGFTVESIDFMDYFGSTTVAADDDFIFVPDACGALVMTGSTADDKYETRNYKVYGGDLSMGDMKKANDDGSVIYADAIMPAFGMKSSSSAFLGIILNGDTISTVSSHRYNGSGTYNRVGTSFRITDVSYSGDEGKRTKYIGEAYSGEINICYRFLSNKNAGYVGLASACREMLIRNSVLSSDTVTTVQHIPLMLTVQAAVSKNNPTSYTKLSTYEQTLDLLNLMKAKSINNIDLRMSGMLDGANNQSIISDAKPISSLGNKKGFTELRQYASTQKFEMFLDIDILTYNKKSASSKYSAEDMAGDSIKVANANPYSAFSGKSEAELYLSALSGMGDSLLSFLNNNKEYSFDGYCINDAGNMLFSDYSDEAHNRSNAVNVLSEQVGTLANNHKIMVDNGNFYMLKNAKVAVDLPRDTGYPETDGYVGIPFAQIILHGIMDYSLEPINLASDSKKAFLKSVEYGAMPSYEWFCTKTENEEIDSKYYYENQLTAAAADYLTADEAIGDLRNARMTAHYMVESGVYCTEYNNSIVIYFNYNSTDVTVNSITVPAMSCFRVN